MERTELELFTRNKWEWHGSNRSVLDPEAAVVAPLYVKHGLVWKSSIKLGVIRENESNILEMIYKETLIDEGFRIELDKTENRPNGNTVQIIILNKVMSFTFSGSSQCYRVQ